MKYEPVHAAVVGAGAISDIYLNNIIKRFPIIKIDAICANHFEHAEAKGKNYHIAARTLDEILADDKIEMIINLTPAYAHYEVIKAALLAKKHVYTEKTLTDNLKTAKELLQLADKQKVYLGCGPDNFLGSTLQTARYAIDSGMIGEVTSCVASFNRDNQVYLSRFEFLRKSGGGICLDMGVYYLGGLIALLGPVAKTAAFVRAPYKTHKNILPNSPDFGKVMDTPNESQVSALLQFRSGITGTLHMNADSILVDHAIVAIYGTKGILCLPEMNWYGREVRLISYSENETEHTKPIIVKNLYAFTGNDRGIGVAEMAWAIRKGRKNRANKELAYHTLEVLSSILESGETEQFKNIESTCRIPDCLGVKDGRGENDLLED